MGVTTGRRSCVATQTRFPNKAKPTWNSSKRSAAIFNVVYLRDSHQRWIRQWNLHSTTHYALNSVDEGPFFYVALCCMPAQNRQDLNVIRTQAFSSTNASWASRQAFQRYPLLESRSFNHREKPLGLAWMNKQWTILRKTSVCEGAKCKSVIQKQKKLLQLIPKVRRKSLSTDFN